MNELKESNKEVSNKKELSLVTSIVEGVVEGLTDEELKGAGVYLLW